eukprot:141035-Chlamydomonas_euryale.AAC.18
MAPRAIWTLLGLACARAGATNWVGGPRVFGFMAVKAHGVPHYCGHGISTTAVRESSAWGRARPQGWETLVLHPCTAQYIGRAHAAPSAAPMSVARQDDIIFWPSIQLLLLLSVLLFGSPTHCGRSHARPLLCHCAGQRMTMLATATTATHNLGSRTS